MGARVYSVVRVGLVRNALLFLMGWVSCQQLEFELVTLAWVWGSIFIAVVTLVHGSWSVVPRLALGFGVAQAIAWTLFYIGDWYYPDGEDYMYIGAFGCCAATLLGSRMLMASPSSLSSGTISKFLMTLVPTVCYYLSVVFLGGFSYALSVFAVHRCPAAPEFVAGLAVTVCCFAILLVAGNGQRNSAAISESA